MSKNPRLIDMAGQRIGAWTVLQKAGNTPKGGALWLCACDCGKSSSVIGADLRAGRSTNCGCLKEQRFIASKTKHGATNTKLYETWKNMRRRCNNSSATNYASYGGRGITYDPRWDDFSAFSEWAMRSGYVEGLTIERQNVDGNYEPDNCTWIPADQQSKNRRMVAKAPDGRAWSRVARDNGISVSAYRTRVFDGWSYEEASSWPMYQKRIPAPRDPSGRFS